jgi:hypothetical protein
MIVKVKAELKQFYGSAIENGMSGTAYFTLIVQGGNFYAVH